VRKLSRASHGVRKDFFSPAQITDAYPLLVH